MALLMVGRRKGDCQMSDSEKMAYETVSEDEIEPVLKLLQGGDPDAIAKQAGITKQQLLRMRDNLLAAAESAKLKETALPLEKIGRNDPCPCGSGKKYKRCCLGKHEAAKREKTEEEAQKLRAREDEQKRLISQIESTFQLLASQKHSEAGRRARQLLKQYPNEDRLHDILANSYQYAGECDEAVEICKRRLAVASSEKDYFTEHGRYRDAEIDEPALSYYYPPMTWLQKYWIALKARDYVAGYPEGEHTEVAELIENLQTADDPGRFPATQSEGLEARRDQLRDTLDGLISIGPDVISYLLPQACRYNWSGILVVDILAGFRTDAAIRALIDISMFGFAYASGASLHHLQGCGEMVVPHIEAALSEDREFDPIKTGIVSVLGNVRNPASYKLLLRLLEHESAHIVNWAGAALGKFDDVSALPAMMAANKRIGGEKMIDDAIEKLRSIEN